MIPVLDFANHQESCTNYYEYLPCAYSDVQVEAEGGRQFNPKWSPDSVDRDELCCFWRAGRDVKAGEELCNRYGYMAPDQVR